MTTHSSDVPICEQSFDDSSLLNFILFSQFMQDNDVKRIDEGNSSEPGIYMLEEFNSADEQERNIKRGLSNEPSIKVSDVYDVSFYEQRRIDDGKSTSEPGIHMFSEFHSADEQENVHLKQSTVKYKKYSDKHETSSNLSTSNDSYSSDASDEYKVSAKKKKNQLSKHNRHLKPAAVKCNKYTTNKNKSTDEEKVSSSDSSDEYEMQSPDSSEDWEMPSSESSDEEETSLSNSSDEHSNTTSDSSDDYGVSAKKKKTQKSKISAKENQKSEIVELSEYEKMVQKNRDEKMAFLQSLKMDEVKNDLNEAIKNLKPKRDLRKNCDKSSKSVLIRNDPPRKSLRLVVKEKALAEIEDVKEELSPILTFEKAYKGYNVYTDFVRDFDDLHFKTSEPITDYVSCFTNMKIDESKIANVINGRITTMALHPMKEKIIVSAGNRLGAISFWHLNSGSNPYQFKPHQSEVPCLKFNPDSPNQIISCSFDGTMLSGDMEKKIFTKVFNSSGKASCSYFDFVSPTTTIVCLRNGSVSIVDILADSKYAETSHKCHECPMKTVSVHPLNKNYFVSADHRGFLSLWDLRHLQKAVIVHRHKTSIQSAFFSPISGNSILVASPDDDSLCLYDCSKLGSPLSLSTKICYKLKHKLKATWLPNTDDAFVIGSFEFPQKIKVFNNQFDNIYSFQDHYFNSTTFINVFHPSLPVLAGGNNDGKVFIFS